MQLQAADPCCCDVIHASGCRELSVRGSPHDAGHTWSAVPGLTQSCFSICRTQTCSTLTSRKGGGGIGTGETAMAWSRILLEKLIVAHFVKKKYITFCVIRRFITVFTRAHIRTFE
jgi:hypothetical protein